jgi:hypothetical protein
MRLVRTLCVVGAVIGTLVSASVASAHTHTIRVTSAPGQLWLDPTANTAGLSVLSVPNIGCTAVNEQGFCTGGVWPLLSGAHWIWKTSATLASQNTAPYGPVIFVREVTIPRGARHIHASMMITADNQYSAYVNGTADATGTLIGSGSDFSVISTFAVPMHRGQNWLTFDVTNGAGAADPTQNPAGLVYKLRVTYQR